MEYLLLGMAAGFLIFACILYIEGKNEKCNSTALLGILCGILSLVIQFVY